MSEEPVVSREVLLEGAAVVAHWGFVYDMPDDLGGGYVAGELLLRGDGVLLRRYGSAAYHDGQTTWRFRAWARVEWWPGESDPTAALRLLKGNGYGLHRPSPVRIEESVAGPFPGMPEPAEYL